MSILLDHHNYFFNPFALPYFVVGFLTFLEGVYIYSQQKKALLNFSYMLSCIFVAFWLIGMGLELSSRLEEAAIFWTRALVFLGIILLTPAIYFFSASWQWTLSPEKKKAKLPVVLFNFAIGFSLYLLNIFTPWLIRGVWHYEWGFFPRAGKAYFAFLIWFFALMLALLLNFIDTYKKEKTPVRKHQARLMIIAFSIAYLGSYEFLLNYGFSFYLTAFLPVFVCINIVGYSVIRYRMMDIETVIHKTIAWTLTTAALIIPFVALLYMTRSWYTSLSSIGSFSYFASLSLLFLFFIRSVQPKVDHFFQRQRYSLEEISNQFIEEAVHLKGIHQLTERIKETISRTLYPRFIEIYIYDEGERTFRLTGNPAKKARTAGLKENDPFLAWLSSHNKIVYKEFLDIDPFYHEIREEAKAYFSFDGPAVVVPLILGEKLLGVMHLSKKANLKRYSASDFHFLTTLKNQSAIAISNSLLYDNMEEQVRQRTDELVNVQKQLTQAEKLATVGTLAGGVAHEINNPLAAILTNAEMLLDSDEIRDKSDRESLELIKEATKRCRTIVKKLMVYARKPLESVELQEVDCLDAIETVRSFIGYQLDQENIKVVIKNETSGGLYIMGSKNELEQVLTNIILNAKDAIKSVKKRGKIYIRLVRSGKWAVLEIEDDGPGIAQETAEKIFDPFFTTKDVGKGLGLGLAICQAEIKRLGGEISVKPAKSGGTAFTVKLPALNREKQK